MPMPLMTQQPGHEHPGHGRETIAERVRAHRERRAKRYGRDRNEAELDSVVADEARELQGRIQQGMRDAS